MSQTSLVFLGVGGAVFLIVVFFVARNLLGKQERVKAADEKRAILEARIAEYLAPVAERIHGTLAGGEVKTERGALSIFSTQPTTTKPPDMTKLTVETPSPHIFQLVPVADAAAVLPFRGVRPVTTGEAAVDIPYKLYCTDEAFAKRLATPQLVGAMKKMDDALNIRLRIFISKSNMSMLAPRGLHRTEDLAAFYEGAISIADMIRPCLG